MKLICESIGEPIAIDEQRDQLARGGQGTVYQIAGKPTQVAKIYHPQYLASHADRRAKIDAMCQNPPKDDATPGHISLAWPTGVLSSNDKRREFKGFLMGRVTKGHELHNIANPMSRAKKLPGFDYRYLHTVAANIASAFAAAHEKGYVVGDVKDANVLVNDRALVTLVDTDSFQVPSGIVGQYYRCTVGTPEYTPPELQGTNFANVDRLKEHDVFGLAVLIFQLLMEGCHPFSGKPHSRGVSLGSLPERISKANFAFGRRQKPQMPPPNAIDLSVIHPKLKELFIRCFDDGANQPGVRPTANEWRRSLRQATSDLKQCSKSDRHYFGNHLKSCPWCERNIKIAKAVTKRLTGAPQKPAAPSLSAVRPVSVAPPPQPVAPPPEIYAGRWRLVPDLANMGELGAVFGALGAHSMDLDLHPGGALIGQAATNIMGMQLPAALQGRWSYDAYGKVLTIGGITQMRPANLGLMGMMMPQIPPQSFNVSYRITSGRAGRFQAFEVSEGRPWIVTAL